MTMGSVAGLCSVRTGWAGAAVRTDGARPALTRVLDDARSFLARYLEADGRVVRHDQGGDTVSEGQGYAMLLAAAIGDRRAFDLAWRWDATHLEMPDHLSSYHWENGSVVDQNPATDADLDMAWALVVAARRFADPSYRSEGLEIAAGVLGSETVSVAGRLELVAGPWARTVPYEIDPSYFAPEAMTALATASGDRRWRAAEQDADALVASLEGTPGSRRLPPDWAVLSPDGQVAPAGPPSSNGSPAYGLDAERVPVWFAASCSTSERALSAATWPILRSAAGSGADLSYSLDGVSQSDLENPLGLVAAAAAADASGDRGAAATLLDRADAQSASYPTYYGDAWVALGRVLLDTTWLSPCPPSPA